MSKNITYEKCGCGGSCQCGAAEQCSPGRFKRVNYFHGMLLTEEDFVDEQTYLREKLKLHNRLHGVGVVWGLELVKDCVEVVSDSGKGVKKLTKLFVAGGLAVDCAGNEIVVCEKYLVPLDEKIDELCRSGPLDYVTGSNPPKYVGPRLYVGIRYCECRTQPAEQYTSECADDRLRPQYARVREGFVVQVFTENELPGCQREGGGADGHKHSCASCGGLHPCGEDDLVIILGYVEGYDAGEGDERDHRYANVTPGGLSESTWAFKRWEAQRQSVLRAVLKETHWVDLSPVIGRRQAEVTEWLKQKGLTPGKTYETGNIQDAREFFRKASGAQRWAEPGTVVDLVTGGAGNNCILFLLVNPHA
jgi:hypothetical protein